MDLVLRLYVKGDLAEAVGVMERLSRRLSVIEDKGTWKGPLPYWKIPGSYEIVSEFSGVERSIGEFAQALGEGWSWFRDNEAVWNAGAESSFVEPLVNWAHLEELT